MEQVDPAWQTTAPIPAPGSEFSAAVVDGVIYVAGGFDVESRLFAFDTSTAAWTERAALPEPRHHAGLAALDGYVYLAGGHDHESQAVDTCWRYDPAQDAWEELPPLPQGSRGALGLAALDGKVYAVGGSSGDLSGPATADCACFDPATMAWTALEPMPTAREHLAVAAASGVLVAVGGRNGGDVGDGMAGATEVFDTGTASWSAGSPLPVPRSGMGVASAVEEIIVIGGEGIEGLYADVSRYDPVANVWDALPSLPAGRHGAAAAYVDGLLYVIGGSTLAFDIQSVADVSVLEIDAG
ncbi:MAG: PQQ-binding-like beta-propeller repeat protein [Chloroflexia bacterium]|nr:PQQ-binding-like beta-propeller repeat protein [Chloroflexia bacterium]